MWVIKTADSNFMVLTQYSVKHVASSLTSSMVKASKFETPEAASKMLRAHINFLSRCLRDAKKEGDEEAVDSIGVRLNTALDSYGIVI